MSERAPCASATSLPDVDRVYADRPGGPRLREPALRAPATRWIRA